MSRSGYSEDCENWDLIRWRGAVASATRGRRGQAFLREMKEALESLPRKRLIVDELVSGGECCAIGAVAIKRGMDVSDVDAEDCDVVAGMFGIAPALAAEISHENDTYFCTPERRYERVYEWVLKSLVAPTVDEA